MSPRSIRRAAERRAQKEARKAASHANAMNEPALLSAPKTQVRSGRTVPLPSDDATSFELHVRAYHEEYKPQGLRESELVQSLAETRWRLKHIVSLETALFAQPAAEEDAPAPSGLDNYLKHEKTLRNLHIQESRLNRRFDQDLAELRQLQTDRMATGLVSSGNDPKAIEGMANLPVGFDFSTFENKLTHFASPFQNAPPITL